MCTTQRLVQSGPRIRHTFEFFHVFRNKAHFWINDGFFLLNLNYTSSSLRPSKAFVSDHEKGEEEIRLLCQKHIIPLLHLRRKFEDSKERNQFDFVQAYMPIPPDCKMTTKLYSKMSKIFDFRSRSDRQTMDGIVNLFIETLPSKSKNDIPYLIELYTLNQLYAVFSKV